MTAHGAGRNPLGALRAWPGWRELLAFLGAVAGALVLFALLLLLLGKDPAATYAAIYQGGLLALLLAGAQVQRGGLGIALLVGDHGQPQVQVRRRYPEGRDDYKIEFD